MKVHSPLANMDVGIGEVARQGNDLVLKSRADSSMDAVITISAGEVVRTLGAVLSSPSGLVFVLGLPYFWLREKWGRPAAPAAPSSGPARPADINKPW
ncbi:MAG: hypothetical protein ABI885_03920 [Gammaproteobacteria bacterium]